MDQERRALRLAVRELTWHREPDVPSTDSSGVDSNSADSTTTNSSGADAKPVAANAIVLRFRLTRGSFATTVLRELIDSDALDEDDQDGS